MDRETKLSLIHRSLGLRHKLKVHESIRAPDTHDELALILLSKFEIEDELRAIEKLIAEFRDEDIDSNVEMIRTGIFKPSKARNARNSASGSRNGLKATSKKKSS